EWFTVASHEDKGDNTIRPVRVIAVHDGNISNRHTGVIEFEVFNKKHAYTIPLNEINALKWAMQELQMWHPAEPSIYRWNDRPCRTARNLPRKRDRSVHTL